MSTNQFSTYAKFYDLLYRDKDYNKEAIYIDSLISRFTSSEKEKLNLLDLACGTGKHLFELSDMGYRRLSGSDISAQMIGVAREKAAMANKDIAFYNYSFQESHQIPGDFDVILSMFSAVNYITSFEDQLRTFRNIHKLLNPGGLFIFDYWNGNAVVKDYSPVKILRKQDRETEIMRISTTTLDIIKQHVSVTFNCMYFENEKKLTEFEEVHNLHYYFFSEMHNLLSTAGLKVLHQSPFMQQDRLVEPYDWNISIVAQKS